MKYFGIENQNKMPFFHLYINDNIMKIVYLKKSYNSKLFIKD